MHEAEKLLPWLADHLGWDAPRFSRALNGGNSNLTWRFDGARDGESCVVRTTPAATISPTAHRGVEREHRVLCALQGHAVRTPRVLGWSDADGPLGRPFLAVQCVDGVSITDTLPAGYSDPVAAANQLGIDLIDQLAAIHQIPIDSPGLEGYGRTDAFLQRQIERWLRVRRDTSVRELPQIVELGEWLLEHLPTPAEPALIHGDYHLDNTLASRESPVILAVIDWELSTIGDPYTDVGLALMLWGSRRSAQPPAFEQLHAISRVPGVLDRRALAERWSAATGRGLQHLDYYMAFAFWRLAAIVEGAYCLYAQGKVDSDYARKLEYNVPALLTEAAAAAAGNW